MRIMDLSQYQKINEGTESNIYLKDKKTIIKIYKNPENYNDKKINELINRQKFIKHTKMPIKPLYENEKLIGCLLHYYKDYEQIDTIKFKKDQQLKIKILERLGRKLQELTDNYIYHNDLYPQNILINKKQVEIIDLDGQYSKIKNTYDSNELKKVLEQYRELILYVLYEDFTYDSFYLNKVETIKKCEINNYDINLLFDKKFNYENANVFLNKKKKEKIKSI